MYLNEELANLCRLAAVELDPPKLLKLTEGINDLLDKQEQKDPPQETSFA